MAYAAPSITASGATFAQFQSGGASGQLELLITAQAATSAPASAHTWTATGGGSSGGSLASGTYYSVVTETNGIGETTAGPVSSQITVASGNKPQITFQTLQTGNTARNVYIGAPGGASSGPFTLYATGVTASTYTLAAAAPVNSYAVNPPAVNTTGLTYTDGNSNVHNKVLEYLRLFKDMRGDRVFLDMSELLRQWNRGEPETFSQTIEKLRHAHTVFAMFAQLCSEMGTLIDANPGTYHIVSTGIGGSRTVRQWP
jgi:hypothetical protein